MDIKELLTKLLNLEPDDATIEKTWTQAGLLSPADNGRKRSLHAMAQEKVRELDMHMKKIQALKSEVDAQSAEWWVYLKKTYGLPEGNFHIGEDGRIYIEPRK